MTAFAVDDVVWAKHGKHGCYWPAVVTAMDKALAEVSFFHDDTSSISKSRSPVGDLLIFAPRLSAARDATLARQLFRVSRTQMKQLEAAYQEACEALQLKPPTSAVFVDRRQRTGSKENRCQSDLFNKLCEAHRENAKELEALSVPKQPFMDDFDLCQRISEMSNGLPSGTLAFVQSAGLFLPARVLSGDDVSGYTVQTQGGVLEAVHRAKICTPEDSRFATISVGDVEEKKDHGSAELGLMLSPYGCLMEDLLAGRESTARSRAFLRTPVSRTRWRPGVLSLAQFDELMDVLLRDWLPKRQFAAMALPEGSTPSKVGMLAREFVAAVVLPEVLIRMAQDALGIPYEQAEAWISGDDEAAPPEYTRPHDEDFVEHLMGQRQMARMASTPHK